MPVPEERGFFGSLNTIKILTESTCADKWDILIETALPAAGEALWMLLIPSPGEILENYLQPQPARSGGKRGNRDHGRRINTRFGGRRWWQRIGLPDIDAIVAEKLPGRDLFKGRQAGRAEQWLWRGIDVLDRGLWYWLLLDASKTFVVEWASGIMESRFCTSPFDALFTATGTSTPVATVDVLWHVPGDIVVSTNNGWLLQNSGSIRRENPFVGVSGQVVIDLEGTTEEDRFDPPTDVLIRLRVQHVDQSTSEYRSQPQSVAPGSSFSMSLNANLESVIRLQVDLIHDTGGGAQPLTSRSWGLTCFLSPDD